MDAASYVQIPIEAVYILFRANTLQKVTLQLINLMGPFILGMETNLGEGKFLIQNRALDLKIDLLLHPAGSRGFA